MKLSVCIDAVFSGEDVVQSIHKVNDAGIGAFEFWGWWNKDTDLIKKAKDHYGMEVSAFCTKMISLVDPAKRAEYLDGLKETMAIAQKLDCKNLITQVGSQLDGVSREKQHDSLVEGLKASAGLLEQTGITLLVEPLNVLVDHKGYYLYSSYEAFKLVEEVGSPYVKVLYDIYHQQITEGNLISRICSNIGSIGHFHAAGNPGRHELNQGEINYSEVFEAIKKTGYQGYVGLEYHPLGDAVSGLREVYAMTVARGTVRNH